VYSLAAAINCLVREEETPRTRAVSYAVANRLRTLMGCVIVFNYNRPFPVSLLCGNEILFRIQIVLARLIDHSQLTQFQSLLIRQHPIDFP
jgi:hypothetical protein